MLKDFKRSINYVESVREVLEKEANEILKLKDRINFRINEGIEMILACEGRVIFTGMGKSGIIGRKLASTFASTGTPAFFLHPGEALHGDLGKITKEDILIAISNSGETSEILNMIPSIKRIGAKMIAISGSRKSTLARRSNLVMDIGEVEEACPLGLAPTSTTTVTLALGDAIAVALLKARDFKPENFALFHPGGSLGRRLLLTVGHVAKRKSMNPVAGMDTGIKEALFMMTEAGAGAVSVIDDRGRLAGILTDGDIRRELLNGHEVLDKKVADLYTKYPVCVSEHQLAAEALRIMEDHAFKVLPVVAAQKPVAMLHIQDLVQTI
ncbi:KpsF/GutQ family sugar-phosphate isomerase [Heyndrickxia coagulans]|jgi:arabinose-5-phosphate isomerase|uniref:Arabinose 5-phosphate isomerase n=1 Tax=Heyndrickxia coagulans TaxID=1398 RepID=A0A150KDQ4_HEYCO|nr:KpsF/GutQ family sugar-phosphate isomerase [Heyndrickxia coagulans]KYC67829.1 Arabinose 5-phosphate isomerase [Heyndrickxia coagulans]MED4313039.1 KpsF/GutQ family sugar-phosphate isomerase [Heyndrickxia coagulans]MED4935248.1 KpsF/GutQ family sugar-phosphate isomerase [Heyndrickxia coagulans]MED4942541.1 KpsF/GutQ family sugar-phosphate isomerase [Heyndrickxia coagulans]MED4964380.1 KpsF/GutQ family sugar-phosphate isomerase [Heyndrickxia coagulans]